MSLQKQQDFLARLFTDESLRQNFLAAPEQVAAENGLNAAETEDLKAILPEELNFFADSLFWKRLREVEKLLPLTKKALSAEFTELFRQFSQNYNAQTVKKHLEDALEFGQFLQGRELKSSRVKDLAKFEYSRLIFNAGGKKIVFARFSHDIRATIKEISKDNCEIATDFPRKTTVALWLRLGKTTKYFVW